MSADDFAFNLITDRPIDVQALIGRVAAPECGGLAIFIGTVRNHSKGRTVRHLEYEAYPEMALKKMNEIALEIKSKWPEVSKIAMIHRTGKLAIGEIAVAIAVTTPHRAEAFTACRYAIDTLKSTAPIWKKEVFEDGDVWASAHA